MTDLSSGWLSAARRRLTPLSRTILCPAPVSYRAAGRVSMREHEAFGAARVESHLTAVTATSEAPGIHILVVNSTGVAFEHASEWADIGRPTPH